MDKREKIQALISLSNSSGNAFTAFRQKLAVMSLFDEESIELIEEAFDKAKEKYEATQIDIYDKWLSEEAVDAAVAFYTSPAGQQVTNAMPHIVQSLATVSTDIMKEVFKEVGNQLQNGDSGLNFDGLDGDGNDF